MAPVLKLTAAWTLLQTLSGVAAQSPPLPTVDLGYNIQQATTYYSQYDAYGFLDVRYAAAPTGQNRFRAPQQPVEDRSTVQKGGQRVTCAQYGDGAGQVEDCLFLDVFTPKSTGFDKVGNFSGLPVLVWIYGGGYNSGSKQDNPPASFFAREIEAKQPGIVYVTMNYRLGALGWLQGPKFLQSGDANAGLLDQRFALDWVRLHISKFGGDPTRVTVIGESAGGGSIMHQITAYGGSNGSVPFIRAIPQSPGLRAVDDVSRMDAQFQRYLQILNVATLDQARGLSFDAVRNASTAQINAGPGFGNGPYGPAVDGTFVPDLPGKLLLNGRFDKNVAIMVGHNVDEGRAFTDPNIKTDADFRVFINQSLPVQVATSSNIDFVMNNMYPPIYDGSQSHGYRTIFGRADAFSSEIKFDCNAYYLSKGVNNQSYAYYFAVPDSVHGSDLNYTFYSGANSTTDSRIQLAVLMQTYYLTFTKTGNPNNVSLPAFPQYGPNATVRVFNISGSPTIPDPAANTRCNIFQTAL